MTEEDRTASILRRLAVEEWCHRDPFGLLESGYEWEGPEIALALRAAARADPARAKDHPAATGEGSGYEERTGLFQGLAEAAPDLAFAAAREMSLEHFYMDLVEVAECFADSLHELEWADLIFGRDIKGQQPAVSRILVMAAEDDVDLLERVGHLQVLREDEDGISRVVTEQRWKNAGLGNPVPGYGKDRDAADWNTYCRRIERWFAADPAAVVAWLEALPDEAGRKLHIGDLAYAVVWTDFQSLDRMLEAFTNPGDREIIMRRAIQSLSYYNQSTPASLRAFIGKHPEARQFMNSLQMHMLDP